jgi:hypothetical protein
MLAERAADPGCDDAEVMRWIENVADIDGCWRSTGCRTWG